MPNNTSVEVLSKVAWNITADAVSAPLSLEQIPSYNNIDAREALLGERIYAHVILILPQPDNRAGKVTGMLLDRCISALGPVCLLSPRNCKPT